MKYMWSKYDSDRIMAETFQLAKVEAEMNQKNGQYITEDDIINLRIDLETSTVEQFLDKS